MENSKDSVFGSQRNQYQQLENLRGQALQQELQIQQQFFPNEVTAPATVKQTQESGENVNPEVVANLLLRTDTLIIKALRIPSDTAGDLAQYPQLVLDLEAQISRAKSNAELDDLALQLRRLEVEFNQKSLENLTNIVKQEQRARDIATKWIIPAIIIFYLIITIIAFVAIFNDDQIGFFNIPVSVLMAGLLGGVTALFIRYRRVTPTRLTSNDIVWFMTKPIIGVLMAGLAYGAILAGFFAFQAEVTSDAQLWPFWITAWAVGFSDWFFDIFIVQILGRISGEDDPDALSEFNESAVLTDAEKRNKEFQNLVAERNASLVKTLEEVLKRRQRTDSPATEVEVINPPAPELNPNNIPIIDEDEAEIIEDENPTTDRSTRISTSFGDESAG